MENTKEDFNHNLILSVLTDETHGALSMATTDEERENIEKTVSLFDNWPEVDKEKACMIVCELGERPAGFMDACTAAADTAMCFDDDEHIGFHYPIIHMQRAHEETGTLDDFNSWLDNLT